MAGLGYNKIAEAAAPAVPPLLQTPSDAHLPGKMVFAELVTPDPTAAKAFYAGLFGWSYQTVAFHDIAYEAVFANGRFIAGLIGHGLPTGAPAQPEWLPFFAVQDVEAAQTMAIQRGARLLFAPHNVPNLGQEAVFADPQGAVFSTLASSSGDPPDHLAAPGEWIWSSLITSDPDDDAAFYQAVFGYDVYELPDKIEAQHLLLASSNFTRVSINPLPSPNMKPRWINYVRVDDAASVAAKAVALGGRVLVPPHLDRHGSKIAIVADPTGAAIGLMEWSENAPAGSAK